MPAEDRYHKAAISALIKDGWTITDQQVKIIVDNRYLFIDIEAAKTVENLIVLVEIKELDEVPSPIEALANAIGKYFLYRFALFSRGIETPLYLGVTQAAYENILSEAIGKIAITQGKMEKYRCSFLSQKKRRS